MARKIELYPTEMGFGYDGTLSKVSSGNTVRITIVAELVEGLHLQKAIEEEYKVPAEYNMFSKKLILDFSDPVKFPVKKGMNPMINIMRGD